MSKYTIIERVRFWDDEFEEEFEFGNTIGEFCEFSKAQDELKRIISRKEDEYGVKADHYPEWICENNLDKDRDMYSILYPDDTYSTAYYIHEDKREQ